MAQLAGQPEHKEKQNGSLASRAKAYVSTEARQMMDERGVNERIAERMDRYGRTVGLVRERIPDNGSRTSQYLDDLAMRLDHMGDRLRQGDYRGARYEVRKLADEHPEIFVGLAFATGALLGRMVREVIVENQQAHKQDNNANISGSNASTQRNPPAITAAGGEPRGPQGV